MKAYLYMKANLHQQEVELAKLEFADCNAWSDFFQLAGPNSHDANPLMQFLDRNMHKVFIE